MTNLQLTYLARSQSTLLRGVWRARCCVADRLQWSGTAAQSAPCIASRQTCSKTPIVTAQGISQRGAAAVEFAIVIVFLLLVLAGIVEFGRAFWYYDALSKATRDGARMLSFADRLTFNSGAFINDARNRVVQSANKANLKPPLTTANVAVTCMNVSFGTIGCDDGVNAPANVRVAITGYTIDIGGMIPFLSPTGGSATVYTGRPLAPQTTMRYMN